MDEPRILSIDIDIIIEEHKKLDELFEEIIEQQFFTKFELQERYTNSTIEKAHYKFYYNPIHQTHSQEEYILLDILFDKPKYQNIINVPVSSKFIKTEGKEIYVSIPSPEHLLGDKLTAFSPDTTGIPYYKSGTSMGMEIMKQLYDIGRLFDVSENMEVVTNTFKSLTKKELGYRNKTDLNYDTVLEDIIQTSLCIVSRGAITSGNFNELQTGIQRVSHFIFYLQIY